MDFVSIKDYEGLYSINSAGVIRHEDKYKGRTMVNFVPAGIMKTKITKHKREIVGLLKNGVKTFFFVHRLVAQAFIHNPINKPQVNHKDGNPLNNNFENLEWATASENMIHAHTNGLVNCPEGKDRKESKPIIKMDLNGNKICDYESISIAARESGFQKGNIISACRGRYQQAYGYKWKYA